MALVPSGKRRYMVAQTVDPNAEMAGQFDTTGVESEDAQAMGQQAEQAAETPAQPQDQQEQAAPNVEDQAGAAESAVAEEQAATQNTGQEGDVRQTVFEFLTGLGYPPRRLQEFKSQFVSETGSADSGTSVTLVLPDEVYGKNTQIPREKLKELVQTVEHKHGLSFTDYKRANEQLTLNFVTQDAAAQQSLEDAGPGDILDKVYGKPAGGGKKGKMARAQTIHEMIKESKDRQFEILKKVLGVRK